MPTTRSRTSSQATRFSVEVRDLYAACAYVVANLTWLQVSDCVALQVSLGSSRTVKLQLILFFKTLSFKRYPGVPTLVN